MFVLDNVDEARVASHYRGGKLNDFAQQFVEWNFFGYSAGDLMQENRVRAAPYFLTA
jgi:hypothetical protein